MRVSCYEDLAFKNYRRTPYVADGSLLKEAYTGTMVVTWWNNIERQLNNMIKDLESARNQPYVDKLRQFLQIWQDNKMTGSINVENLKAMDAAASMLAADGWKLSSYFGGLKTSIQKLQASEEELPRTDLPKSRTQAGGGGGVSFGGAVGEPGAEGAEGEEEGGAGFNQFGSEEAPGGAAGAGPEGEQIPGEQAQGAINNAAGGGPGAPGEVPLTPEEEEAKKKPLPTGI